MKNDIPLAVSLAKTIVETGWLVDQIQDIIHQQYKIAVFAAQDDATLILARRNYDVAKAFGDALLLRAETLAQGEQTSNANVHYDT